MVETMWASLLKSVVEPCWEELTRMYEGTAPAANGVDVREAFNPLHHAMFEEALRQMMERAILPYPRQRADGARYAVWVERQLQPM